MKKIIFALLLCASIAYAKEEEEYIPIPVTLSPKLPPKSGWYSIDRSYKCFPNLAPANFIEVFKRYGTKYRSSDDQTKDGKPVQVRLTYIEHNETLAITFFRGKPLCEKALDKMKRSDAKELDRYR